MNVSLTPRLEKYINRKVKEGKYQTASEVVREALRLLQERDEKIEWLRAQLRPALEAADRREFSELTMDELKAEARRRFALKNRKRKIA